MNAASDATFVDRDSGALPIAGAGRVKLHGPAPLYWINRMLARRLFQVVVTTLISGSPLTKWRRFSAISSQRRRTIPAVQPEQCGVMMIFGNSWHVLLEPRRSGSAGSGYCHQE